MFNRIFKIPESLSFFLFGARGTGKTTLLESVFKDEKTIWIDLLDRDQEAQYQIRPAALEEVLRPYHERTGYAWVIIDEIQKVPALLDVVHRLIEQKRWRFALTGSSARKLKRGAANLLAGRALQNYLFPLTHLELGEHFALLPALQWGSLPQVFALGDAERTDYLRTYVNTYLKEEVQMEQLVRNLPPFRAFLEIAAQCSGTVINYSKIARDIGSDPVSVKSYFQILEDTLLGFSLPAFHRSVRKQQRKGPKFYFFDLGVIRALERSLHIPLQPATYAYGRAFEHWVVQECYRLNHYYKLDWALAYLLTKERVEVDLIVERPGEPIRLIEIKSTSRITPDDTRSVARIARDMPGALALCLSNDPQPRVIDEVHCLHWQKGLRQALALSSVS